jgi:hypothetical protein
VTDAIASADQRSTSTSHVRVIELTALQPDRPADDGAGAPAEPDDGETPASPSRPDAPDSTVPPPPPASASGAGDGERRRRKARQPKAWSIGPPEHVRQRSADAERDRHERTPSLADPDEGRRSTARPARGPSPSGRDVGLLRQFFGS